MKDFDSWNEIKKQIDTSERMDALFFYEKELWWVNMGVNVGDEENGKGRD